MTKISADQEQCDRSENLESQISKTPVRVRLRSIGSPEPFSIRGLGYDIVRGSETGVLGRDENLRGGT